MSGLAEAFKEEFNSDGEMHAHVCLADVCLADVCFATTGI
jgi:hypothetical protein